MSTVAAISAMHPAAHDPRWVRRLRLQQALQHASNGTHRVLSQLMGRERWRQAGRCEQRASLADRQLCHRRESRAVADSVDAAARTLRYPSEALASRARVRLGLPDELSRRRASLLRGVRERAGLAARSRRLRNELRGSAPIDRRVATVQAPSARPSPGETVDPAVRRSCRSSAQEVSRRPWVCAPSSCGCGERVLRVVFTNERRRCTVHAAPRDTPYAHAGLEPGPVGRAA